MSAEGTEQFNVARRPCSTCPYRCDTPPGVWAPEEYHKLTQWDEETFNQPPGLFLCHHTDDKSAGGTEPDAPGGDNIEGLSVCRGWLDVHGGDALGVRLAIVTGTLDPSFLDEEPSVDVYPSGTAACEAGLAGVENPDEDAVRLVDRLIARNPERLTTRH